MGSGTRRYGHDIREVAYDIRACDTGVDGWRWRAVGGVVGRAAWVVAATKGKGAHNPTVCR